MRCFWERLSHSRLLFHPLPFPSTSLPSSLPKLLSLQTSIPCNCLYLVANQPLWFHRHRQKKMSRQPYAVLVKWNAGMLLCTRVFICTLAFFIDPSGSWAAFMQMRQHLNICPKQLTWNKCFAAQKHVRLDQDVYLHTLQISKDWPTAPRILDVLMKNHKADCDFLAFTKSHKHLFF